ncbi:MAG TPA: transketolase C-terminal domain-containing protein [Chlamydiales bacterium]|nr:transketolase C-terminal domain-containing protein [Chlamydiales bacterium]
MQDKALLLIATESTRQTADKVGKILCSKGITTTIITPHLTDPNDFNLFTQLLSTNRFVATFVGGSMGMMINNFMIQKSIREAQSLHFTVPDMWVQFGSNTELMRELGLDAESIARRILQEFFVDDYRSVPKRKEKAVV